MKQAAAKQVDAMANETSFNFNLENIDMFKFQDKDFREEKKKVQAILAEQQAEQAKKLAALPQQGRNKRQAAINAMEDVHSLKLNRDKPKKSFEEGEDYVQPTKDKSVQVSRIYEWQFYPDFEKLQELSLKIQKL